MKRCACCWNDEALQHQAFQASQKEQRERMHSSREEEGRMMNPGMGVREARCLFANSATAEKLLKGPFMNASMAKETAASHHCGIYGGVLYPFKDYPQPDLNMYSPHTPQTEDCAHFLRRPADSCSPGLSSPVFKQSRDPEQRSSMRFLTTPKEGQECRTPANRVALYKWYLLRPRGGQNSEVAVGGLLALGTACNQRVETAAIAQRLEKCRLLTKDGLEILLLGLIDDSTTVSNGFSVEIMHSFLSGFPYIWNHLVADERPDGGGHTKHVPSVSCDLSGGVGLSQLSFEEVSEERNGSPQNCDGKGASLSCNTTVENADCHEDGIVTMEKETSIAAHQAEGLTLLGDEQEEMTCVAHKEQITGADHLSEDTNLHGSGTAEGSEKALMKAGFSNSTTLSDDYEKVETLNQDFDVVENECTANGRPTTVVTHEEHPCEDEALKATHEATCPGINPEQYMEEENSLSEQMHSTSHGDGKPNTHSSVPNRDNSLLEKRSVKPLPASSGVHHEEGNTCSFSRSFKGSEKGYATIGSPFGDKEEIKHYYLRSRRKSGATFEKDDQSTCKSFNMEATKEGNLNPSSLVRKGAVPEEVAVGEVQEVFADVQIGQAAKIKNAALSPKKGVHAKKTRHIKESSTDNKPQKHGVASYVTSNVSVVEIQEAQVSPCETGTEQDNLLLAAVDALDKERAKKKKPKVRVKSEDKLCDQTIMVKFSKAKASPKTGENNFSNKGIPSDKEEPRRKKAKPSNMVAHAACKTSSILPPPLPCPRVRVSTELITTAFGLKTSRSGRLLVPPLAHWQGQRVMRNTDGGIVAISHGMEDSLDPTRGFKPPSEAALKKLQKQLCTVATECLNKNADGDKKKPYGLCPPKK